MLETEATNPDADVIRQQMACIRRELRGDVEDIVFNAQQLADWSYYVRTHPWVCLTAAIAVGYLGVPKRPEVMRPDTETLQQLARKGRLVFKQQTQQARRGPLGSLVSFAGSMALRLAAAYVGRKAGELVTEWAASSDGSGAEKEQS